jgi:hypothetical protein
MVSSVLSPEKVVGRQNTNKAAAQNFISGGSILGASVVNSAANKIVGFQRAGVQPAAPAIDSIVSTISTNINNNVTNTVNKTLQGFSTDYQRRVKEFNINKITTNVTNTVNKTLQGFSTDYQRRVKEFNINKITTNVTNIVNKTLQGFSTDYQNRIKQVDDAKPIGILGKFLNVYKTALGFINFFGNKKNIDKVRDSLDALKKSFTESFEVAKLIRQVIIKIVKQLSNLPVASPSGGGGLNLDVDIPGGGLKKSAPRGLGRMMGGKGKMLALGAGALGLGAAGAGAVNALSDSPQAQAAGTSPEIPGDIGDRFSSIVDRFANAISKLFETNKQKSKQESSGSSGGGGGGTKASPAPGSSPSAGSMGAMGPIASGSADEKIAAYTSALEGTGGQNAADAFQVMLNRTTQNHSGYGGLGEQVMARGQFTPMAAAIYGTSGDNAANSAYGHIAPMLGKTPEERKAKLRQIVETEGLQGLDKIFKKNLAGNANAVLADFKSGGPLSQAAVQGVKGRAYFKGQSDLKNKRQEDFYRGTGGNYFHGNSSGKIGTLQPSKPGVAGAQTQATQKPGVAGAQTQVAQTQVAQTQVAQVEAAKTAQTQVAQKATAVSQTAQTKPQVNYLPINASGGGQQQTGGGGGGTSGPPSAKGNGPSVPFLPAGNPDNFLVLYSRMVYNIVDG